MNDIPKGNNFREITLVNGRNSVCTLKVENFAGTKFRGFRGFRGQPRNLILAKPLTLPISEIYYSQIFSTLAIREI